MTDPVEALRERLYQTPADHHHSPAAPCRLPYCAVAFRDAAIAALLDVVPTGDAGLDAAARGVWQAWDDAMEHADDDGFVDAEWWAPLVGAMDALYARLSSSDTGVPLDADTPS